ncbi:MAG TPA: hypothetical protein VIC55_12300, partial [Gemmatimonadaceae bacterium]
MNAWRMAVSCVLAASTVTAAGAAAQQKKSESKVGDDKCKIDFGANEQVRAAYNNVTLLQLSNNKPDDARKKIKSAVSTLTAKSDFGKDQNARNFALGEALVAWYNQPGGTAPATRGDLGYSSQPTAPIDVLSAADSAFTAVETANPDCADNTSVFRQQPWAKLINQVGPLLAANNNDSASVVLSRAMTIYRGSPYDYYFQGQIAQKKNDWAGAVTAFSKATELSTPELAAKDSNVKEVKEFTEFSSAYSQLRFAQGLTGDQQKDAMRKAADMYRVYIKDYPGGANAQPAQAGLTAALKAAGDTASLASLWKDMKASPTKYTDSQLYDAGTQAFTAKDYSSAVQLMELGQQQNPYLRAGLFNLANAYWKNNQFDKMLAVADTLAQIDPNNPDNYQLIAIAYQGQVKAVTDPKQKKALTDSISKYVVASDKLPVRVSFSEFTHDGSKYTLSGTVENPDAKPKAASFVFKFIDKSGKVVTTDTTAVTL